LEGHNKKVTLLAFNPVSDGILSSISEDGTAIVWDYSQGKEAFRFELEADNFKHITFNSNGSLIATTTREKKAIVFDPRSCSDLKGAQNFPSGLGPKKSTILFADNQELLITVGTNARAQRVIETWDPRELTKRLACNELDSSPGNINCNYDPDNSILWLMGKGDASIKYFEVTKEPTKGSLFFLSAFTDTTSQKSGCFFPKRCLDTKTCEIARALRVVGESAITVSFSVPRKSDLFQKDLYPDTYAGVPSLTAAEYLSGKNADPKLISMKPGAEVAKGGAATHTHTAHAAVHTKSSAEYEAEIAQLKAKVAELEARLGSTS